MTLLSALLTPILALLTAYIAWQQWKINQRKFNWDRYERRLRIYESTKSFLAQIMQKAKPDFEDIGKFIKETAEADFLFEPEIANYLHEIRNHANDLRIFSEQYRDSNQLRPEGYNHAEIVDGMHRELSWLAQQFEPKAKEKFAKYLSIGK